LFVMKVIFTAAHWWVFPCHVWGGILTETGLLKAMAFTLAVMGWLISSAYSVDCKSVTFFLSSMIVARRSLKRRTTAWFFICSLSG